MKFLHLLTLLLLLNTTVYAQGTDTAKNKKVEVFSAIEQAPEFPWGMARFYRYIASNLKCPEVANLIGLKGRVILSFIIEKDCSISEVTPRTCIGAGCESEAASLIQRSPKWMPGIQNSQPVRVQYNAPIQFNTNKVKVTMKELRKSDYGFLFFMNGKICTIDEAEAVLGNSFLSNTIETAEQYANEVKYPMPGKKEVYLLKMKG